MADYPHPAIGPYAWLNQSEPNAVGDNNNLSAKIAIEGAFCEHMKGLFASFVRHLPNTEAARLQFRKDLAIALQARSEMMAIAEEVEQ